MLANIAWIGFVFLSSLRMASYVPQLWRIAVDKAMAQDASYTTWALWTCTNISTTFYAALSLNDMWLALVSAVYVACGLTAIVLKTLRWLQRLV